MREAALESYLSTGVPCSECYAPYAFRDLRYFEPRGKFICFGCWGELCAGGFDPDWGEMVTLSRVIPHIYDPYDNSIMEDDNGS